MNITFNSLTAGIMLALTIPSTLLADSPYIAVFIGSSQQATDSEPYGNNIAEDADFPGEFDAGDGTLGGIGIGYRVTEQFRIEGRLAYREASFNDRQLGTGERNGVEYILNGDFESTTLTVEGFYDFPNNSSFTPYVKAGVGLSDNAYSARIGGTGVAEFDPFDGTEDGYYDNYADGDSTEFSWNAGLGGIYAVSERISVVGEYQYASFGDIETGQDDFTDGFKIDGATAHEVVVGVTVMF